MNKLSKTEFTTLIKFITCKHKQETKFCKVLEELSNEAGFCDAFIYTEYEAYLIKLLHQLMNDKQGWIEYWLYDCDYGKSFKMGSVTDKDGLAIDLSTPDLLYDFLVRGNVNEST